MCKRRGKLLDMALIAILLIFFTGVPLGISLGSGNVRKLRKVNADVVAAILAVLSWGFLLVGGAGLVVCARRETLGGGADVWCACCVLAGCVLVMAAQVCFVVGGLLARKKTWLVLTLNVVAAGIMLGIVRDVVCVVMLGREQEQGGVRHDV